MALTLFEIVGCTLEQPLVESESLLPENTLRFVPEADSFVSQNLPDRNYGLDRVLKLESSPLKQIFLRFKVMGLASKRVVQVLLRLYIQGLPDGSPTVPQWVQCENDWDKNGIVDMADEKHLTFNSHLECKGTPLIAFSNELKIRSWIEVGLPVSSVDKDGFYTFSALATSPKRIVFYSRERQKYAPELRVGFANFSGDPNPGTTPNPDPGSGATPAPTPIPSPTPTPNPVCQRAYSDNSPWNTKIASAARTHSMSQRFISALSGNFGSDPNQYTYPVYSVTQTTPLSLVRFSNRFSIVSAGGTQVDVRAGGGTLEIPIPVGAKPSQGTDGQIIVVNHDSHEEWGLWQAAQVGTGVWRATNGYRYNTLWSGVPPTGFFSRGAGVPYFAGLIRRCEIDQLNVNHAIAFAYDYPCRAFTCAALGLPHFVFPATRSDGIGDYTYDFPEGTRLQLNPNATEADVSQWCSNNPTCRTLVKALQDYGMITIDNSGHPKIYPEDTLTAHWGALLDASTPSKIPYSAFRVLE